MSIGAMEEKDKPIVLRSLSELLSQKNIKKDFSINLVSEGLTSLEGIANARFINKSKKFWKEEVHLLFISHNFISHLPDEIGEFVALTNLWATHNCINNMSPQISRLTNLEHINLNYNRLEELPISAGFGFLKELGLQNNLLKKLPDLSYCSRLEVLHLNHNNLCNLTDEKGNIILPVSLISLSVSNNKITSLPKDITQLSRLMFIDISYNPLNELSIDGESFTRLSNLNFSNCCIKKLSKSFGNIQYDGDNFLPFIINLSANQLSAMPANFDKISGKFLVSLEKNCFTRIGKSLCKKLKYVTHLNLALNPIYEISLAIELLQRLIYLDLSNCQIKKLPRELNLCQLDTFKLNNNQLMELPDAITQLTNLNSLQILDNHQQLLTYIFDDKNNKAIFNFIQRLRKQKNVQYGNPLRQLPTDMKREIYKHL